MSRFARSDPYGTPHPSYDPSRPRFRLYVDAHEPGEEPGWTHKLRLVDRKFQDSDGYPIDAVAAGDSWPEAFETAGRFMDEALRSEACVF